MDKEKTTRQRLAEWSKTPEGRESYEKVAEEMRREISEKPIIPDLEKELARFYLKDLCGSEKDEIPEATLHHNFPIMWDDLRDLAHHFAQWGAEHLKK